MINITIVEDVDEAKETYPAHVGDEVLDEAGHPVGPQPDGSFIPFSVGESTDAIVCLACLEEEIRVMIENLAE